MPRDLHITLQVPTALCPSGESNLFGHLIKEDKRTAITGTITTTQDQI